MRKFSSTLMAALLAVAVVAIVPSAQALPVGSSNQTQNDSDNQPSVGVIVNEHDLMPISGKFAGRGRIDFDGKSFSTPMMATFRDVCNASGCFTRLGGDFPPIKLERRKKKLYVGSAKPFTKACPKTSGSKREISRLRVWLYPRSFGKNGRVNRLTLRFRAITRSCGEDDALKTTGVAKKMKPIKKALKAKR